MILCFFLDDDINIANDFILKHLYAVDQHECSAQVGCVLQPSEPVIRRPTDYENGARLLEDLAFPFNSDQPVLIRNCMAGNLLVRRELVIACGGFDENFEGAAYRFETEFCRRLCEHTGKPFYYVPYAKIDHLRAERGGTRELANYLSSLTPLHSCGDYYFALRCGLKLEAMQYIAKRFLQSFSAKFYLRKPWLLPARQIAELRGIFRAIKLTQRGSRVFNVSGALSKK